MKSVLVTGANKGIGLAVVEAILREQPGYRVILGSRNSDRGKAAKEALQASDESWPDRIHVLEIDVGSDRSVSEAGARLAAQIGEATSPLYGVVNNAGAITGSVREVLDVNVRGIHRVCEVFAPRVEAGGRIVNVTSASGPNFVTRCDAQRHAFFTDEDMTWERLERFMQECAELDDFASLGMDSDSAYGLSKACANVLTIFLARRHPELFVNACTPGYINTDLGRETLGTRTPEEAGMKTPADGARVIMKLLFDAPRGRGHYYGSDGLRSPIDHYRAPGSPEHAGD
ncbi:MAG: SDR family NAD(P)-dependent oxidoreductase [Myxococcota bacterium]|jgi:NAD(P)-dependent dehydrogenase (short-subunit alcohol dehydrogenase family)|nr:SDR family NAD(P)-dependent oxidoreductase [Myxococcota bacterium]